MSAESDFTVLVGRESEESGRIVAGNSGQPRTSLVVHLPENAKLFLGGNETETTGALREFTTMRLDSGDAWEKYSVRAVMEDQGQEKTRDVVVTLRAGETRTVTLDFNTPRIADVGAR